MSEVNPPNPNRPWTLSGPVVYERSATLGYVREIFKVVTMFLVDFLLSYSITFVYGVAFIYRFFKRWLKNPFDFFWKVKKRETPPACLNDPAYGTHGYLQLEDVKLHYVEKGERSRPLMLCVHGFPEFWYSWRHQLVEFSSDYWVVAIDMRGYGDSDKPEGRKHYKLSYLEADIKNVIKALGKEKCTLVSHDWGGIICWYVTLLNPHLIDAYVVLNSANPLAFSRVIRRNQVQRKKSWYIFFYQWPCLPELALRSDDMKLLDILFKSDSAKSDSSHNEDDLEAYKYTFGKPRAFTYPINYYRANFNLTTRDRLKDHGQNDDFPPGLILFGEKDNYIEKDIQEETLKLVKNLRLVYIKDANHFVQQDDPESVNREMRKFLKEVKSS